MKKKFYNIDSSNRQKMLNDFYQIIAEIKNKNDAKNFLKDLLTPAESVMIIYRIEVAKMLLQGFRYEDIQKKLQVGTGNINNVNKWLYSGFGGYMKEIKKAENQKQRMDALPKNEWEQLKKKYPAHFLIFNLLDKIKNKKE
jgi:TrpR-related protein YerC/YecD